MICPKFFTGPLGNQKFSLAPSAQLSSGQTISSAPLTSQGGPSVSPLCTTPSILGAPRPSWADVLFLSELGVVGGGVQGVGWGGPSPHHHHHHIGSKCWSASKAPKINFARDGLAPKEPENKILLPLARHLEERKKSEFSKNFQVTLNNLNKRNLGAFGGPWRGLHGPSGYYVGLCGCPRTRIVTK